MRVRFPLPAVRSSSPLETKGISIDRSSRLIGYLLLTNKRDFMKKLLMVSNGTQLFYRIGASVLAGLACVLFSFAFLAHAAPPGNSGPPSNSGPNVSNPGGDQGHVNNPADHGHVGGPPECTVCHVPPGNNPNVQTLTISCTAVDDHIRNHPGDCLGPCPCQPTPAQNR